MDIGYTKHRSAEDTLQQMQQTWRHLQGSLSKTSIEANKESETLANPDVWMVEER